MSYEPTGVLAPLPLNPQPHEGIFFFTKGPDPWHADAFVGTPAEGHIPNRGERKDVWMAEDWCRNVVGILGQPEPFTNAQIMRLGTVWCWVTVSYQCLKMHYQACHICEKASCGDNINPELKR